MDTNLTTTQGAFFEFNTREESFIANAHFTNSFTDIIERFINISNCFGDRLIEYRSKGNELPFIFHITFTSDLEPFVFSAKIQNNEDFHHVLITLKFAIISYLENFLEGLPTINALRLANAYAHSAEISYIKYHSHTRKNIFSDCLISFRDFFDLKSKYYKDVLRLDKYEQFVHIKHDKQIDGVRLCNVSSKQFTEIVEFYSNLVVGGGLEEIRYSLSCFFDGRPDVDFLVLSGQKNQIADSFFQLYKNEKIDVENATVYKEWINKRFRVMTKGNVEFLKPTLTEIFKSKNKPAKNKRFILPDFLNYFK